jgi:hypothetical protein
MSKLKDLRKIEHVVLYQYYLLSENSSELAPASEISEKLTSWVTARRVEVAVEALVANGMLEDEFLPQSKAGWRITRRGLDFVDRQLKQPASFIARLAEAGFSWLSSSEAMKANIRSSLDQARANGWKDVWEGHESTLDVPSSEDGGYLEFADKLLVAVADEQEPPGLCPVDLEQLARRHGLSAYPTWLKLVGSDLQGRGLGKTIGAGPGYKFLLNGMGLNTANKIRGSSSWSYYPNDEARSLRPPHASEPNWGKWGVIATALSIIVAVLIAIVS